MSALRSYANADDFARCCPDVTIDEGRLEAVLEAASRDVDGMVFNRISAARKYGAPAEELRSGLSWGSDGTAERSEGLATAGPERSAARDGALVGFDALTPFQRELVKRAVCLHAAFREEYGEWLDSPLAYYSINGVSIGAGANRNLGADSASSRVEERGGVKTSPRVLALLRQTGLCWIGLS